LRRLSPHRDEERFETHARSRLAVAISPPRGWRGEGRSRGNFLQDYRTARRSLRTIVACERFIEIARDLVDRYLDDASTRKALARAVAISPLRGCIAFLAGCLPRHHRRPILVLPFFSHLCPLLSRAPASRENKRLVAPRSATCGRSCTEIKRKRPRADAFIIRRFNLSDA